MMAAKSEVGLDKEPQSGSGSSGDHALGASPEPITLESMDFVGSFPEEVTYMILSHLSANSLENCSSDYFGDNGLCSFLSRRIDRYDLVTSNSK
ncbi:uncharacterized protein LOC111058178 isoform X4 [Nilaparvata lugens]|uniref:uncharacterized protein LOC111058178 isoform X4 n=1 Tax=Nilaparvata lugens TaxID=108931 RepID=UPI00193D2910|nr:uncharacterized protein LOC111058178 isoform X4 [Nilaparvata lugens]